MNLTALKVKPQELTDGHNISIGATLTCFADATHSSSVHPQHVCHAYGHRLRLEHATLHVADCLQ